MNTFSLPINRDRIWQRLMELAEIGRYGRSGVDRQALTPGDLEAKRWLIAWARARGLDASTDAIGNLFVRLPGRSPQAEPVAVGSHLDTEASGGRFDGAYGVVAAMELIDSLMEQRIEIDRPVDLVAWTNEEGSRFRPGCMGSKAYVDPGSLPALLAEQDDEGVSVAAALKLHEEALPDLPVRRLGASFAAFIEAHIEQGPVLERAGKAVAAVHGIQGRRVYEISVTGRTAHAGTTPYEARRDALEFTTGLLGQFYARAAEEPAIRITPGRLVVEPNSPSVVPGRVRLTVDIRHPDASVLNGLPEWLSSLVGASGRAGASIVEIDRLDPVTFDPDLVEAGRVASIAEGGLAVSMVSGASHDSHVLAGFYPTAMIFVRCREGISHHEDEYASPDDLAAGARALAACLLRASSNPSSQQPA